MQTSIGAYVIVLLFVCSQNPSQKGSMAATLAAVLASRRDCIEHMDLLVAQALLEQTATPAQQANCTAFCENTQLTACQLAGEIGYQERKLACFVRQYQSFKVWLLMAEVPVA